MQRRRLREFEEPAIAVEKPAVIRLQEGVWREARRPPAGDLADQPQRKQQRKSANDPVADIELHEPHDLGRHLGKVSVAAGVTIPVEHEMGREHAAPRHRGDVRHQRQRAVVAEVADHAQVVERGPKSAARECEAETGHAGDDLLTGPPIAPRDRGWVSDVGTLAPARRCRRALCFSMSGWHTLPPPSVFAFRSQ